MDAGVWPYQIMSIETNRNVDYLMENLSPLDPKYQRLADEYTILCWKCGDPFKNCEKQILNWDDFPHILIQYKKQLSDEVPAFHICDDCCKDLVPAVYKMQDVLHTFHAVNILQRTIQCQKKNDQQMKSKLLDSCERCLLMLPREY